MIEGGGGIATRSDQKQIREDSMLAKTDALELLIRVGKLSNLMH